MFKEQFKLFEKNYKDGVYISLKLADKSKKYFNSYLKKYLSDYTIVTEPHLTLIFSKKPFEGDIKTKDYVVKGSVKQFNLFDNILVAEIDSGIIKKRNKELTKKYNFVSDFKDYKPHISLAYNFTGDLNDLPPMEDLYFDSETVEELDLSWDKKLKES